MKRSGMIVSFSLKDSDVESLALINELKLRAVKKGLNFSHMVLEGLRLYNAHQVTGQSGRPGKKNAKR